jgi:hypothetical protein
MEREPMFEYILIRLNKQEQKERRERAFSGLYRDPKSAYMRYNMQHGEILALGEWAELMFPEAKPGMTLLFHHTIEGKPGSEHVDRLVDEDETYRYYVVKAKFESVAVHDGVKVIPAPERIFIRPIEIPTYTGEITFDEHDRQLIKSGELFLFQNYKESKVEIKSRMDQIQKRITDLAKIDMNDEVKNYIRYLESELSKDSLKLQIRGFAPYRILAYNPILEKMIGRKIDIENELIYILAQAAQYEIHYDGIDYQVGLMQFAAGVFPQQNKKARTEVPANL